MCGCWVRSGTRSGTAPRAACTAPMAEPAERVLPGGSAIVDRVVAARTSEAVGSRLMATTSAAARSPWSARKRFTVTVVVILGVWALRRRDQVGAVGHVAAERHGPRDDGPVDARRRRDRVRARRAARSSRGRRFPPGPSSDEWSADVPPPVPAGGRPPGPLGGGALGFGGPGHRSGRRRARRGPARSSRRPGAQAPNASSCCAGSATLRPAPTVRLRTSTSGRDGRCSRRSRTVATTSPQI